MLITGAAKRITRKDTKEVYHRWWSQINDTRWVSLYTIFDYWRTSTNMKRDKQVKLILWLEDIEHITPLWVKLWLLAQKFVSLIEIHFPTGLILGSLSFSSLALLSLVLTFVFKLSIQRHMFKQINVQTTSTKKQSKQQKPQPLIPIYQTSVASRQVATNKSSIYPSPNAPCMEYLPAFIIKSKPFM